MTSRLRIFVALTLACFVGWVAISWGLLAAENIVRHFLDRGVRCTNGWQDAFNVGCSRLPYNIVLAFVAIIVCLMILGLLGWLLMRWVLQPFRQMASTVDAFGPTSLGLRTGASAASHEESARLAAAIDAMLDRVAEGYEAQRRFAANASHELRTPLATQRALIEVSLASTLTPDQQELLARQLLSTNERNENLIEGLLVLAETERGLMAHSPVRLDVIASDAVALHRPTADEAQVSITTDLAAALVTGESALLERMASNLVQNAIKYNQPGGTVHVTVDARGSLTVSNSGPVVAAEQVPMLFEPFRRLTGERLDHAGGVGLGLTIVRSIVAAHHGGVVATANLTGGLTVTVSFPRQGQA